MLRLDGEGPAMGWRLLATWTHLIANEGREDFKQARSMIRPVLSKDHPGRGVEDGWKRVKSKASGRGQV